MLIDKGYYDYDYEEPKHKKNSALRKAKSDAETAKMLSRFGVGTAPQVATDLRKLDMEQLQAYAMREAAESAETKKSR